MCGGCCVKGLRFEEGTGKLQYFSCNEWRDVQGVPPAAINPDPPAPDPDDPINTKPTTSVNACYKANALADLVTNLMDTIIEIRGDTSINLGFNSYLAWRKEYGSVFGSWINDTNMLTKVFAADFFGGLEDNVTDWNTDRDDIKQAIICYLIDVLSPNPIPSIDDYNYLIDYSPNTGSQDLDDLYAALVGQVISKNGAVAFMTGYVREEKGNCDACNPPAPVTGFEGLESGCVKSKFKAFARHDAQANFSGDIYAQPMGARYGAGFIANYNGDLNVNRLGVVFEFSEPVVLQEIHATMKTTTNVAVVAHGRWLVSVDGTNWILAGDLGTFISADTPVGAPNLSALGAVKFAYLGMDTNGASAPYVVNVGFTYRVNDVNGFAALDQQYCF